MTDTRTYVRLLRHLGIALIFTPEPFTTPFGVAFMLVARHLSKRHKASVNNRLREMLRYYLAHTGHFGDYVHDQAGAPGPVKPSGLLEGPPILGQITGSRSLQTSAAPSVRQSGRDGRGRAVHHAMDTQSPSRPYKAGDSPRVEPGRFDTSRRADKVIHHTIDVEWLSRRYESVDGAVAHSSWATTSDATGGITRYSLNVGLPPQTYRTASVGKTKTKSRAVSTAQHRPRHGSAVSHTTVVTALQNNNCYYDMLSRKNVIGGY